MVNLKLLLVLSFLFVIIFINVQASNKIGSRLNHWLEYGPYSNFALPRSFSRSNKISANIWIIFEEDGCKMYVKND